MRDWMETSNMSSVRFSFFVAVVVEDKLCFGREKLRLRNFFLILTDDLNATARRVVYSSLLSAML